MRYIIPILAIQLVLFSSAQGEWDTYQNDASHDGYVPVTTKASLSTIAWQKQLPATNLTGVAIGGGGLFVSNGSKQTLANGTTSFFALDENTGNISWTKSYSSTNAGWPLVFSVNAPAYSNGKVYLQTSNNDFGTNLYSYNAADGSSVYVAPFGSQWETYLAPTPFAGSVYIDGGRYGGMYSFSATANTQNWFAGNLPQFDSWTPALTASTAYAYVGSGVFAVNRTTGAAQFYINDPNNSPTYYSMHESIVLGSSNDAFITNNGRLVSFSLLSDATHTPHIQWVDTDKFTGQLALAQGTIFCADGPALQAVSEASGADLWNWTPPDNDAIVDAMVVTNNELFLSTTSDVYAISLTTHQIDNSFPVAGNLALSDNMLFVSGSNGMVTAINVPEPIFSLPLLGFLTMMLGRAKRSAVSRF